MKDHQQLLLWALDYLP